MASIRNKRLAKELKTMHQTPHEGITLVDPSGVPSTGTSASGDRLDEIFVELRVADNPLYAEGRYLLRYRMPTGYPIESPDVQFVGAAVPLHPHIYSNGHICLDILYSGWSPVHGILSLAMSIQSMLAGNTLGQRPPDDEAYSKRAGNASSKKTHFVFHDDSV